MEATVVDRLHGEFSELLKFVAADMSLQNIANDQCRKGLLLSVASHFEHVITTVVTEWVERLTPYNAHVVEFVRKKGISYQYHTWFDWKRRDVGAFSGLLGAPVKDFFKEQWKGNVEAEESLRDFLELGESRNRLVHQDFGTFTLEKTTDDIYLLYQSARRFPGILADCLKKFS